MFSSEKEPLKSSTVRYCALRNVMAVYVGAPFEGLGWQPSHASGVHNVQERNADMLWLSLAKTLHVTVPSVCTSGHPRIGPLEKCDLIMQDPKAKKALNDLSSSIG